MKKKYKHRHAILKILYDKIKHQELHFINFDLSATTLQELADKLKIKPIEVREAHYAMHKFGANEEGEHVSCDCSKEYFVMKITDNGMAAYIDEYWLREGEKERNEKIYDKTKWMLPIATLLFSIVIAWYSFSVNQRAIRRIQERVDNLQNQINNLKSSSLKPVKP